MRREDQDKINRFSRLHQREMLLEEELKSKHASPGSGRIAASYPRHATDNRHRRIRKIWTKCRRSSSWQMTTT